MADLFPAFISALVSSSVAAAVVGVIFVRRNKQIEAKIKHHMDFVTAEATSHRTWKERSVADLLGPVYMQLDRTRRAFERWTAKNLFLEAKAIREGNIADRDLLLKNGLIPGELLPDAGRLIEHYDRWLEEYEKGPAAQNPDLDAPFIFVGPQGHPFPRDAEERLKVKFTRLWAELYNKADLAMVDRRGLLLQFVTHHRARPPAPLRARALWGTASRSPDRWAGTS
jgi:hypothetical protein